MIALLLAAIAALPDANDRLPPHAIARLAPARFHLGASRSGGIALSPDGRHVVASYTGGVGLWSTVTGRQVATYKAAGSLGYSPDGRTIALLGLAERGLAPILLIDAASGRETGRLPGHAGRMEFYAFAGNHTLVTADENLFHVWDLNKSAEVRTFPRPGRIYSKPEAVSPDGRYLARVERTLAATAPLHVYEIATGREVCKVEIPGDVWSLAFAPDGKSVVGNSTTVYRYEIPSGKPTGTWQLPKGAHWGALACAKEAVYLLASDGGTLTAHDVIAGRKAEFPLRLPVCVAYGSAAGDLYVVTSGSRLEVWDLATGRPRHPNFGHIRTISNVAFAADGSAVTTDDQSVHHWDAAGREEQVLPCRSTYGIYTCVLSPDGRTFATGDPTGVVRVWDTATGKQTGTMKGSMNVACRLTFAPDGRTLAFPGWRSLQVWDVAAARQLWDSPTDGREYSGAVFAADGRTLFSGNDGGMIQEWDVATGKVVRKLEGNPEFMERPEPGAMGIGRRVEPRPGHMGRVSTLVATSDGRRLVTAGDLTLRVWELATGRECALLERETSAQSGNRLEVPYPLAVSPDGAVLAAPGQNTRRRHLIDLWDLRGGRRFATLEGHRSWVSALAFSPDSRRLISGGEDTIAFVWEVPPRPRGPVAAPTEKRAAALWADLAAPDAVRAYRALGAWAAVPESAVAAFRKLSPPAGAVDDRQVGRLIADLDSEKFAVREAASKELRRLGPSSAAQLRKALATSPSAEAARRIKAVLAGFRGEELRGRRAVEVLEAVGTREARMLLEEWSKADPTGVRGREATAALTRLGRP